jgi:hypothetical protein
MIAPDVDGVPGALPGHDAVDPEGWAAPHIRIFCECGVSADFYLLDEPGPVCGLFPDGRQNEGLMRDGRQMTLN